MMRRKTAAIELIEVRVAAAAAVPEATRSAQLDRRQQLKLRTFPDRVAELSGVLRSARMAARRPRVRGTAATATRFRARKRRDSSSDSSKKAKVLSRPRVDDPGVVFGVRERCPGNRRILERAAARNPPADRTICAGPPTSVIRAVEPAVTSPQPPARPAPVGTVDVEPKIVRSADLCYGLKEIDRTRTDGSRRGHDRNALAPAARSSAIRLLQPALTLMRACPSTATVCKLRRPRPRSATALAIDMCTSPEQWVTPGRHPPH